MDRGALGTPLVGCRVAPSGKPDPAGKRDNQLMTSQWLGAHESVFQF